MKFEPRSYQPPAIQHLRSVPFCGLWADMGLGKSVSALTATAQLIDRLYVHRTLVVAPLRVAQMVWAQEAAKWDHLQHLSVRLIRGTPEQRLRIAHEDAAIHVINYDNLVWLVKARGGKWPWDQVILDESSKIKNMNSWRSRALWHVRPRIRHLKQLTGTPASRGLEDLYGQVLLLDKGQRLGRTKSQFLGRWFYPDPYDQTKFHPKDGALESITETLRDVCLSLRARDYFDLNEIPPIDVPVELPVKRKPEYRKLEREMFLELEQGAIDSPTAAATTGKCQQFANGQVWLGTPEDSKREWAPVHDAKLEALQEIIDGIGGKPLLVAYWFKPDLARLKAAFPHGEVLDQNPETEARWNRGEIPLLFAHPDSAGHGLNLQHGGHHIAFFSLTWNLELYQQIIERLGAVRQYQAGYDRPVYVYRIVAQNTIDELMLHRLDTRASTQDVLKDAMRRRKAA